MWSNILLFGRLRKNAPRPGFPARAAVARVGAEQARRWRCGHPETFLQELGALSPETCILRSLSEVNHERNSSCSGSDNGSGVDRCVSGASLSTRSRCRTWGRRISRRRALRRILRRQVLRRTLRRILRWQVLRRVLRRSILVAILVARLCRTDILRPI